MKGKGIQDVHCRCSRKLSENDRDNLGDVYLSPIGSAKVFVEGEQISDECLLQQGCMITLGDSIFLRFNFPAKAAILKNSAMESNKVLEKTLNTNCINFTEYSNSLDKSLNNNSKITEKMKNLKTKSYDSYPKISNLQVYPVSSKSIENCANLTNNNHQTSIDEMEELEDVLKMFVEYNNSNGLSSGNIHQGKIFFILLFLQIINFTLIININIARDDKTQKKKISHVFFSFYPHR